MSRVQRPAHRSRRQVHNLVGTRHHVYERTAKPADAIVCDRCALVWHGGRWFHGAPPFGEVRGGLCPACRRIHDRFPAGTVRVPAASATAAREIHSIAHRLEESERAEHPLERLMDVVDQDGTVLITTTGIHLARRITAKLERLLRADATFHYGDENELRVEWPVPVAASRSRGGGRARKRSGRARTGGR